MDVLELMSLCRADCGQSDEIHEAERSRGFHAECATIAVRADVRCPLVNQPNMT